MSGLTHLAGFLRVREDKLVDDDVVGVDLALSQLLDQPLRLVQGQEFGKNTVQGTGLARGGRFEKYIGSLRGNGPNVRTDTVESNIERTQSCYKNSVIC